MSENISQSTVTDLNAKYNSLKDRATKVAESLEGTMPLTGRSNAAQQAFLLVFSDLQLLEQLLERAENTFNAIAMETATPEQIEESGDFLAGLAELATELVDAVVEELGVLREVVMPAVIKDLSRQIELIEKIVERAEVSLSAVMG